MTHGKYSIHETIPHLICFFLYFTRDWSPSSKMSEHPPVRPFADNLGHPTTTLSRVASPGTENGRRPLSHPVSPRVSLTVLQTRSRVPTHPEAVQFFHHPLVPIRSVVDIWGL